MKPLTLRFIVLFLFTSTAFAQFATGTDPEAVADEGVRNWLARAQQANLQTLAMESPEAFCEEIAVMGPSAVMPTEVTVNFSDRWEIPAPQEGQRVFSYPARVGNDGLARVRVLLTQEDDVYRAEAVDLRLEGERASLPAFMRTEVAGWVFIALTAYLIYLLARPSWYRRLLRQGWLVLRAHRGVVIAAVVLLYGAYGLGSWMGASVPECQAAVATIVGGGLSETGVVDVLEEGSVPHTAAVITYWNFLNGTIFTTLIPAFIFGIPAYLLNFFRFMFLGVALAPADPQFMVPLLFHLPVIIIELMAYILVTAGGGMFLMTLIREGFKGFSTAATRLLLMVPIAFLLLVIGAWYESYEILRLVPMVTGTP